MSGYHLSPYGVGMIGEYLTLYREHKKQVTVQKNKKQRSYDCWSFSNFMEGLLGVGCNGRGGGFGEGLSRFLVMEGEGVGG